MWTLADQTLSSRLLLGSAQYPSLQIMREAIIAADVGVITVSLKRESSQKKTVMIFGMLSKR